MAYRQADEQAGTCQLFTREGIANDHEAADACSVSVRDSDGLGAVRIDMNDKSVRGRLLPPDGSLLPERSERPVSGRPSDHAQRPPVRKYSCQIQNWRWGWDSNPRIR